MFISGNVTLRIRLLAVAFIRLAAVVYAIVVLIVPGLDIVLITTVARNVTCPFAGIARSIAFAWLVGRLLAAASIGGLFTRPALVVGWAAGRIIIDRLVHGTTRVPVTTTRAIVCWVVRRLLGRV